MDLGSILRFVRSTGAVSPAALFTGNNGRLPAMPLTPLGDGTYVGTAVSGGSDHAEGTPFSGWGTIYRFDPVAGTVTALANFAGRNLGGATLNGSHPWSSRSSAGGDVCYGTHDGRKRSGGSYSHGYPSQFTYNPADPTRSRLTLILDLGTQSTNASSFDRFLPKGDGSTLYASLGDRSFGGIYRYSISTNTLTKVVCFTGANGKYPQPLADGGNGLFYGSTSSGGGADSSVMFSCNPANEALNVIADFSSIASSSSASSPPSVPLSQVCSME